MSNEITQASSYEVITQENTRTSDFLLNGEIFRQIEQFSSIMAAGKATVPQHLKGNSADCMAVTMQALQWGMNPFAVAQKTHLVNGSLGYEAQLVNAVVTTSNAITGRFHYEYSEQFNDDKDPSAWVRVGAIIKGEDDITWGEPLYPSKQTVKNSPLWTTDPKQQSAYLALKRWARLYTPAVILGVYTPDELQEIIPPGPRDITPTQSNVVVLTDDSQAVEDNQELQDVIEAIKQADSTEALKAAVEKAKSLPEKQQAEARKAYDEKVAAIKKSKPKHKQPEKTKNSNAYVKLAAAIEMSETHEQIDTVIQQPDWSDLVGDEAKQLQAVIAERRKQIDAETQPTAEGIFGG